MSEDLPRVSLRSSYDEMYLMCMENRKKYIEYMYEKFESLGMKAYIHIMAAHPSVVDNAVIRNHANENGTTILNIASSAVLDLSIDIDYVSFTARFNGIVTRVVVPMDAIYAIANAEATLYYTFPSITYITLADDLQEDAPRKEPDRPTLSIVK